MLSIRYRYFATGHAVSNIGNKMQYRILGIKLTYFQYNNRSVGVVTLYSTEDTWYWLFC